MGDRAELRRGPSGDALGYRIGRPGDVTATGQQVFYSGSKLAPDLSLPQLHRRWDQNLDRPGQVGRLSPAEAADVVVRARVAVGAPGASEGVDGIAHASGDVLAALAANDKTNKHGWTDAAERYERASRTPGGRIPDVGPVGADLRLLARRLLGARGFRGKDAAGSVALAIAVAGLLQEIAAWQRARDRAHQAAAADAAGARLRSHHQPRRDWAPASSPVQGSGRERARSSRNPGLGNTGGAGERGEVDDDQRVGGRLTGTFHGGIYIRPDLNPLALAMPRRDRGGLIASGDHRGRLGARGFLEQGTSRRRPERSDAMV